MENVTIELVEKPLEIPFFIVKSSDNVNTIRCFCVIRPEDFEATKAEAIEYAKVLRSDKGFETRTLIEF